MLQIVIDIDVICQQRMRMLDQDIAKLVGFSPPPPRLTADTLMRIRAEMRLAGAALPAPDMHSVQDFDAGGVPVRVYMPAPLIEPRALLVLLHGGGWMLGDLDTHDAMHRIVAKRAGCAVVGVGYRLAPEYPFPAALDDVAVAWSWACGMARHLGCDPARIAIAGESAGANLAAALTLRLRGCQPDQPRFQLLVHPVVDLRFQLPSFDEVKTPGLDREYLGRCAAMYAGQAQITDPLLSPLCAERHIDLPPAIILTAEEDPLRDDGEYYARALAAAGVEALCRRLTGLPHGFMFLPETIPAVSRAFDIIAELLRRYFATQ